MRTAFNASVWPVTRARIAVPLTRAKKPTKNGSPGKTSGRTCGMTSNAATLRLCLLPSLFPSPLVECVAAAKEMLFQLYVERKWIKPLFEFDENTPPKKIMKKVLEPELILSDKNHSHSNNFESLPDGTKVNDRNWIKNFDPVTVEDLAVHNKKIQEVDEWLKTVCDNNNSDILLLSGPVGCGKTVTLHTLATKHNIKVTEWITPIDVDMPTDYGEYVFKEKQSTKFLDFVINAANFTSLLDNNNKKLVLVDDFPNTFMRTPSEFTSVLHQYKQRAKSPIVFICSESHTDSKSSALNLFTPSLKEQFNIHHIVFNSISATGLRAALNRVSKLISKKYTMTYNIPTTELIECVVNSSTGDVRSAVLNLHFACLRGSNQSLETNAIVEKETKTTKKKKHPTSKFSSIGKDHTISILHGVGRVLNPKVVASKNGVQNFTHSPQEIIEQFLSQPNSFLNFLEENYLPHFSCIDHADKAATALSEADYMLSEWREKMCQEYGLYTLVAGLMLANKSPVSAWQPVRGPKSMKIQYPTPQEIPNLEQNYLYKGKVLVTDYQTYCKIIDNRN